jgi:hypothetical protein
VVLQKYCKVIRHLVPNTLKISRTVY